MYLTPARFLAGFFTEENNCKLVSELDVENDRILKYSVTV